MSYEYTTNNRVFSKSENNIDDVLGEIVGDKFVDYRRRWDYVNDNRVVTDFPLYIVLEQRFKCNLKCPMCILSYPDKVTFDTSSIYMSDRLFLRVMTEAREYGCPSISMNNTEEPLLGKDKAIERIRIAKKYGFVDIMMNTNGVLLNERVSESIIDSGLTRLLIGFDGNSKETYEKIRVGASYEKVKSNIERFLHLRKKKGSKLPIVRLSFVVNELNQHEVDEFYEYWKDKVDYVAFQDYVRPPVETPDIMSQRCKGIDQICDQPWNRVTVRANGEVLPCCSFWGYYLNVGNVNSKSIYDIWNGAKIDMIRSSFESNSPNDICNKCMGCY